MKILKSLFKTKFCALLVGLMLPLVASSAPIDDFFIAIKNDKDSAMVAVLFRGFDANTLDSDGRHGLHVAMMEGSLKVAKTLLDLTGTKVDIRNNIDETPLMLAALKGHTEFAKRLIQRGADINKKGWSPLHYAATSGQVELIKLLLEKRADIDATAPDKTTPLMMAARFGNVQSVQLLIDEGADFGAMNDAGMTALDFASMAPSKASFDLIQAELKAFDEAPSKNTPSLLKTTPAAPSSPLPVIPAPVESTNKQPFKTLYD